MSAASSFPYRVVFLVAAVALVVIGLMLLGAIVGLGPLAIVQVLAVLLPSIALPNQQFYFLTLGLIPITFSIAAVRGLRNGAERPEARTA